MPPPQLEEADEQTAEELFSREMQDVTPLKKDGHTRVSGPPPEPTRRAQTDEAEALAELYDLVAGRTGFDITDTDEYIEGCISGLDTRLVRKLRQGDFSRQAALDLHGMTVEEAQAEVEQFLMKAVQTGLRCVLLIHGRGRNSPGQVPVLKDRLKMWLTRSKLAKIILAFSTARQHDGGPGALYVLLRRERDRKRLPVIVLEGAKR
ncbi:MAG: Smr/MutS family protein [Deltaproteobacteria bacterium]|nr:Smr/MutS family protein [Deltaproteobacteria bacterium]